MKATRSKEGDISFLAKNGTIALGTEVFSSPGISSDLKLSQYHVCCRQEILAQSAF